MNYLSVLCALSLLAIAAAPCKAAERRGLDWWQKTIVYQIYPKSFADTTGSGTGDLAGVIAHLDHLKDLGVGAVWLTPVYPSPMVDNGYDIADYTDIDPSYGTMEDFDRLVAEAKARDIRVVMDLVFNHSSDQHPWFIESKKSRDNPKADWYVWRDAKPDGSAPTNWRSFFGGSAWTWCEQRKQYYLHTFASEQPDLNWENPDVRRALFAAARFWLDKGVGGFRVDAVPYIKKPAVFADGEPDGKDGLSGIHAATANQPGILDFLHEFKREVCDGRDIFTVGEANGVGPDDLKDWVGERGVFDMVFEFSHLDLACEGGVWCRTRDWKLTELKRALMATQRATAENGWCPVFFENHDQPRSVDHFFPKGADRQKCAKVLAAVLQTLRGTPFVYQGEELGLPNFAWKSIDELNDIQSRAQYEFALEEGFTPEQALEGVRLFSRDNARTPMLWDGSANAGFTTGKPWLPVHANYAELNAAIQSRDPKSVLNWYRRLSRLRREHEELTAGSCEELLPENEQLFAFARVLGERRVVTVANFSQTPAPLPKEIVRGCEMLLSSDDGPAAAELAPLEARIYATEM